MFFCRDYEGGLRRFKIEGINSNDIITKMNDLYKPIAEVKTKGNFVEAICFKPKMPVITFLIIGILMLIPNNIYLRILGIFCIAMAVIVLKLVEDHKVIDVFDEGVMIYENDLACFIDYDDIKMWTVKHDNGHDTIEFHLNDGTYIIKDSFQANKAYKVLNIYVKEKEEKYIRAMKDRENPLSIPDVYRKIKNRRSKK